MSDSEPKKILELIHKIAERKTEKIESLKKTGKNADDMAGTFHVLMELLEDARNHPDDEDTKTLDALIRLILKNQ